MILKNSILFRFFGFFFGCICFITTPTISAQQKDCEEVFSYYYDNFLWGCTEDGGPSSGWGSHLKFAKPYIEFLTQFIHDNQITSVVDLGCGSWEFSQYIDWDGIDYVGVEVVKQLVDLNNEKFATDNIKFIKGDILTMDLPDGALLVCKDVLQHLQDSDIQLFLSRIKKYNHCLITNDIAISIEDNIELTKKNRNSKRRGSNRPLDLTLPPFNVKGDKVLTYPNANHIKQTIYIQN